MTHILIGADHTARFRAVAAMKDRLRRAIDAIDSETIDADRLAADALKKALLTLPASGRRLVCIRDAHRLSSDCRRILREVCTGIPDHLDLIIESSEWKPSDPCVKALSAVGAQVKVFVPSRRNGVFDMTRLIEGGRTAEALKVLRELLEGGVHPLQILGGMVWFWGQQRRRLTEDDFVRGLRALQATDLQVKRSRLRPHHALEILVVRLAGWSRRGKSSRDTAPSRRDGYLRRARIKNATR